MSNHATAGRDEPESAEDFQQMLSMITGFWVSQIVGAVAKLSIAEQFADGPLTAVEAAERASTDPAYTYRLLRSCVTLGLFEYADGRFAGTPLLATLRAGSANSLKNLAIVQTAPGHWLSWGRFPDAIREGVSQTEVALGTTIFEHFGRNPDEADYFSRAMTDLSTPVIDECVPVLDLRGVSTVVDVGGANGAFVFALMADNPGIKGVVLDLPHVVGGTRAEAERWKLDHRFDVVGGDFFDGVPAGDLYLLKYIMHDWDDEACVAILQRCRESLNPGGRVAIVDIVLGAANDPGIGTLMDMNMAAMLTGKERELGEFTALLKAAGFRITNVTAVQAPYAVIEAEAV
ncbi:MAG: hypothetical protein JWQ81_4798 [Amycolatopsis sp.]|jgi:hypothetical protein|nr:hypothetical protein [Amycolatopsis sp.]